MLMQENSNLNIPLTSLPVENPLLGNPSSPTQQSFVPSKLFIGGLSYDTTEDSLSQYFSQYGEVCSSIVLRDPSTSHSRGFGFVTFTDKRSAEKVLAISKSHVVDGRKVEAKIAVPRSQTNPPPKKYPKNLAPVGGMNNMGGMPQLGFPQPQGNPGMPFGMGYGNNFGRPPPAPMGYNHQYYDMHTGHAPGYPPQPPPQRSPIYGESSPRYGNNMPPNNEPAVGNSYHGQLPTRANSHTNLNVSERNDSSVPFNGAEADLNRKTVLNLFIPSVPDNLAEENLRACLSQYGPVQSLRFNDRGEAYVKIENNSWDTTVKVRTVQAGQNKILVQIVDDEFDGASNPSYQFKLSRSNTLPIDYNFEDSLQRKPQASSPLGMDTPRKVGEDFFGSHARGRYYSTLMHPTDEGMQSVLRTSPVQTSIRKEPFVMNRSKSINVPGSLWTSKLEAGSNLLGKSSPVSDVDSLLNMSSLSLGENKLREKKNPRRLTFHPSTRLDVGSDLRLDSVGELNSLGQSPRSMSSRRSSLFSPSSEKGSLGQQ